MGSSSPSCSELLDIGNWHYSQKEFSKAEAPLREAVRLLETEKGRDHRRTLVTKVKLGVTLFKLAKYDRSEVILKDATDRYEATCGAEDKKTLASNFWLARVYFEQRKYGQAETILEAFERLETIETYDHTGSDLLWRGRACLEQTKFAEAQRVLQKAIERAEGGLGKDHEKTIGMYHWLGRAQFKQNKYSDAEKAFRKVAESSDGRRGTGVGFGADATWWLGLVIVHQNRYGEAEPILRKATGEYERTLGWDHEQTLIGYHWLGETLYWQNKFTLAENSLRKALEGLEKTQRADHGYIFRSQHWLGRALHRLRRWSEAEGLLRTAAAGMERSSGPNATATLLTKYYLGISLLCLKKNAAEAEGLLRSSTSGLDVDAEFYTVWRGNHWLGLALHRQQKYDEAGELFKQAAERFRTKYGKHDEWTIRSYFRLGENLYWQGKYEEAESPLQHAVDGYMDTKKLDIHGVYDEDALEAETLLRQVQEHLSWAAAVEATETVVSQPMAAPGEQNDQQPCINSETIRLPVQTKTRTFQTPPGGQGPARGDYTVGWICALPIEMAAAEEMLDDEHGEFRRERDDNDENLYVLGSIGKHNTVIVCLPAGRIGSNPAAAVATQMRSTFRSIRFVLMVGIGGGVPSAEADVRLGDVVVGQPHNIHGGVVQYDMGKATPRGFARTGMLNMPPPMLLAAVARVRANEFRGRSKFRNHLSRLEDVARFQRAKAGHDILFDATYDHEGHQTCEGCRPDKQVSRPQRDSTEEVVVHYGTIASGNQVMRTATERDRVSKELGGVLCFEMEGAGLMNNSACLMVRGICDYSDSHKNKSWQAYAAGTAAAWAKELLSVIPAADEA